MTAFSVLEADQYCFEGSKSSILHLFFTDQNLLVTYNPFLSLSFFFFKVEKSKIATFSNLAHLDVTGLGLHYRVSVASGLGGRKGCGLITAQIGRADAVRKPCFKYR